MGYVEGLLGKNEQIVIKTRRHWIVLAQSFIANLIILLILLAIVIFLQILSEQPRFNFGILGLLPVVLMIFPILSFLRDYLEWWNEEYIVTNRRVIQAEGVINKHVIDSSLEKVNDVVLNQSLLGRLLDYGDIEIMTASELGVNMLRHIAQPVRFKTEMMNQRETM